MNTFNNLGSFRFQPPPPCTEIARNIPMPSNPYDANPYSGSPHISPAPYMDYSNPGMSSDMPFSYPAQDIIPDTMMETAPETMVNPVYMPAVLREYLGKIMRVEFLVGDQMTDRIGRLIQVGDGYITLQSIEPNSVVICDLYSIRFVTVITSPGLGQTPQFISEI